MDWREVGFLRKGESRNYFSVGIKEPVHKQCLGAGQRTDMVLCLLSHCLQRALLLGREQRSEQVSK